MNNTREKDVDIFHMLLSLLAKWRWLLVFILIGACIGAVMSYTKAPSKKYFKDTNEPFSAPPTLSENDIYSIEQAAFYYKQYLDNKTKLNDSSLGKILRENPYDGFIFGVVDAGVRTEAIMAAFQTLLAGDDFYNRVVSEANLNITGDEFRSFVSFKDNFFDIIYGNSLDNYNERVFRFTVTYSDEKTVNDILDVVGKLFEEAALKYKDKYPGLSFEITEREVYPTPESSLAGRISVYESAIASTLANYTRLAGGYNDAQKAGLKRYLAGEPINQTIDRETYTKKVYVAGDFVKNMLVIGLVLALAYCVVFCATYVFSDKIVSIDYVTNVTDSRVIFVDSDSYKNILDRKIAKAKNKRAGKLASKEYAKTTMELGSDARAMVVSCLEKSDEAKEFALGLNKDMFEYGEAMLSNNIETLKKAAEIKNVWLVVKAGKSKISELCTELKVVKENELNLKGIIIL